MTMTAATSAKVEVVMATYGRPLLLARALASLREGLPELTGVVLVNNAGDEESARVAREVAPVPLRLITPPANLGTGGGIAAGLRQVLDTPGATHAWVMDDDACATPGALTAMLTAQQAVHAGVIAPLVVDSMGLVTWIPGPLPQPAWDVIRSRVTPQQFREKCGVAPLRWNWATWASLLLDCRAVRLVGLPRDDLWYQGTDIEYTLRLTACCPGILAPAAVCIHLPPPESVECRRRKDYWALRNNAYIALHLRHGWRAIRHLPGNHFRHWRAYHDWAGVTESFGAFWRGGVCGRPAGREEYQTYVRRKD